MMVLSDLAAAPPSALVALAISLSLYTCYSVFVSYWRLRDVPGPFWAKFTDFQRMFWVKTMRAQEIHREAHEKYGDCVRFGPNTVSLCDPAMIPTLYPMRSGFLKSLFYRGIMPYAKGGAFPAVFTTQNEQMHKTLKTPVASLYSLTNVINFEPFIDEVLEVMFNQLDLISCHSYVIIMAVVRKLYPRLSWHSSPGPTPELRIRLSLWLEIELRASELEPELGSSRSSELSSEPEPGSELSPEP
ncbi:hypothetical protein V491_04690 [Pseudogymnoascus sp. VKM F-3775]|nr:hypothetical protein V491_04690 [Pseudogymnoascus sp. VKM F-3775]